MTDVTDMRPEKLQGVLADPVAVELLDSEIPSRLAYIATDGTPRVALTIDTNGFPPHVLLVRDTASVEIVEGIPSEYFVGDRIPDPVRQLMRTQRTESCFQTFGRGRV